MIDFGNIRRYEEWKRNWKDREAMNLWKYISFNIHPEDVLILGSLLLPNFIEIEQCILLSNNFDKDLYERLRIRYGYQMIEKDINRVHIYDIFANCEDDVEDSVFERVGAMLKISWSNYLIREFPHKEIIVEYSNDQREYGPTLTAYQR